MSYPSTSRHCVTPLGNFLTMESALSLHAVGGSYMVSAPRLCAPTNRDTLPGLCSTGNKPIKRVTWVQILRYLEFGSKKMVNWCPGIPFPTSEKAPKSRQVFRRMVNMFFNPQSALRLCLVPLEGVP